MPVSVERAIEGPFTPNGVTTSFPFDFKAASADEIIVVDQDGTALSSALYSVTIDDDEGGSVDFSVAPDAADYDEIYIASAPAMTQPADFDNSGPSFNPEALTRALDRAAVRDISLKRLLDRCLKVPFVEDGYELPAAADLSGKFLAGDADGRIVASAGTGADAGLRTDMAASSGSALSGFIASAVGASSRSVQAKLRDAISVKDFGAVGDDATDDTAAFTAATDHAASTGQAVHVPKGVYLVDAASLLVTGTGNADRFVMVGEGADSVIKVKDGSITADGKYLFRVTTAEDIEVVEFRDLFIDMNARNNPLPGGDDWAFQHCHAFNIAPTAGTIKQVRFSNVVVKDPVADGFNCSHTGTAVVASYNVENCAVIDRDRVRSDVCFATLPVSSVIDGFDGEVIEVECVNATPAPVRMHVGNCRVDRLDIVAHTSDFTTGYVEVYLDNVSAKTRATFQGLMLRASNCSLGVQIDTNYSRWWCFQPGSQFSDCLFLHEYDGAQIAQLQPMTSALYNWRTYLRFVGCEFRINDSGAAITPTGAAILGTSGVTPATLDNTHLEIIGCRFDKRFATSVFANQCGRVRMVDNAYGGTVAAVKYQSGAATAVDLSVEGGDYRRVTGAMIGTNTVTVDQVAGIGYLRLSGDHIGTATPWVAASGALPSTSNNQLYSNRRLLLAATPTKGILGDIVEIVPPVAGAVDSYRCTVSPATAGGSATWKARTTLAA